MFKWTPSGRWRECVRRGVPPLSWAAAVLVVGSVALAALVRLIAAALGGGMALPFSVFFPAVLVCALLAGPLAGAAAAILGMVLLWTGILPPNIPTLLSPSAQAWAYATFAASSAVVIWLAEVYRRHIRAFEAHERERRLLIREMEHRSKNSFAIMQAIVFQSLEGEREKAEEIVARMQAVSSINELLTHAPMHAATLRRILEMKFEAFDPHRVSMEGETIELAPEVARGMSLVIHELVTNAIKHGALQQSDGRVVVTWRRDRGTVRMRWSEEGGPKVAAPESYGFGSRLVTRTLAGLGGGVDVHFEETGLVCDIQFAAEPPEPREAAAPGRD